MTKARTSIRVGQRLIYHDGNRGYVRLNSDGKRVYGPGETFYVVWLGEDGEYADTMLYTLEQFADEGITFGRGVMPWAR